MTGRGSQLPTPSILQNRIFEAVIQWPDVEKALIYSEIEPGFYCPSPKIAKYFTITRNFDFPKAHVTISVPRTARIGV